VVLRYALKMYILTGEDQYLNIWSDSYEAIMKYSRGVDSFLVDHVVISQYAGRALRLLNSDSTDRSLWTLGSWQPLGLICWKYFGLAFR